MSKRIYIGRHAKSSWDHPQLSDHDRPLNSRGKKDAPFMARMMERLESSPSLIITSSANRALSTARAYQEIFFVPDRHFWIDKRIYHASLESLVMLIQEIPEEFTVIYIFGHNPTMHNIADLFINVPKFSTAGILSLGYDDLWSKFAFSNCEFKQFYTPKGLQQ